MPPSPIPAPLPAWAKVLIWFGPPVAAWLYDHVDFSHESTPDPMAWRRLVITATRTTPAGTEEDKATMSFDLINVTGGAIDDTWTTGDFTTCETAFNTWLTALQGSVMNNHTFDEYRWYRRQFNTLDFEKPYPPAGPPVRRTTISKTGGAGSFVPYQVACSVTEHTPFRKHWGRFYLPGVVGSGGIGSTGRYSSGTIDAIVNATNTLYGTLAAAEFFPIVPVTQVDKTPARILLGVTQVHGDDVPDIIRRRRGKRVAYRKTLP